ncbi:MAG: tetratricopeptide repeat protein [Candidatus Rifleibacteriota bacterium]
MGESSSKIRDALLELVARRDPAVFQDPENFELQIKKIGDWPEMPEITGLKAGLKERFPWELQKDAGRIVTPATTEVLAQKLIKKHQIDEQTAYWAVETWAIALGLKIELPEHARMKPQKPAAKPPAPPAATPAKAPTQTSEDTEKSKAESSVQPEPPPAPKAQPTAKISEPDTSNTRLGVIFATDEKGLVRVYKSWFGHAPENESSQLLATPVKIEKKKTIPLFTAATRKKKTASCSRSATSKKSPGSDANREKAPELRREATNNINPTRKEPINFNSASDDRPSQPTEAKPQPEQPMPGDDLVKKADALLGSGRNVLNLKKALSLLQTAVKKGSIKARRRFGEIYLRGIGVKPNLPNAASWFKTAAKLGDVESQLQLGSLYQCGSGVDLDLEKAQYWLQKAANQGNKEAEELLAQILKA